MVFLSKNIGVCTEKGIIIVNPTKYATSLAILSSTYSSANLTCLCGNSFSSTKNTIVPDFSDAPQNMPMYALKSRADKSRVLGLVKSDNAELLVIYEGSSLPLLLSVLTMRTYTPWSPAHTQT